MEGAHAKSVDEVSLGHHYSYPSRVADEEGSNQVVESAQISFREVLKPCRFETNVFLLLAADHVFDLSERVV